MGRRDGGKSGGGGVEREVGSHIEGGSRERKGMEGWRESEMEGANL